MRNFWKKSKAKLGERRSEAEEREEYMGREHRGVLGQYDTTVVDICHYTFVYTTLDLNVNFDFGMRMTCQCKFVRNNCFCDVGCL